MVVEPFLVSFLIQQSSPYFYCVLAVSFASLPRAAVALSAVCGIPWSCSLAAKILYNTYRFVPPVAFSSSHLIWGIVLTVHITILLFKSNKWLLTREYNSE